MFLRSEGVCHNQPAIVGFATKRNEEKQMNVEHLDLGDVVYAAHPIVDDGSMPVSYTHLTLPTKA